MASSHRVVRLYLIIMLQNVPPSRNVLKLMPLYFLRFTCGKMTFEEAYKKTGRILCITLSATTKKAPPVLINYISAPNVTIASAVVASAAVPGFIKPVILQVKGRDGVVRNQSQNFSYCDGSIDQV
jgi:predicted acylesterase/phospholipase RssA